MCKTVLTTPVEAFVPMSGTDTYYFSSSRSGLPVSSTSISTWTDYFTTTVNVTTFVSNGMSVAASVTYTEANITTISSCVSVEAEALFVVWEETDLPNFSPAYATSLAKRIGLSLTPSATPASPSSLPTRTTSSRPSISPSKGLSTGARVGIGVGSAIVLLLAISLIAFIVLRKRRKHREATTSFSHQRYHPEMEDQDASLATRKWFLRGRWRSEVETPKDKPSELDSRSVRVVGGPLQELDGTSNLNRQN